MPVGDPAGYAPFPRFRNRNLRLRRGRPRYSGRFENGIRGQGRAASMARRLSASAGLSPFAGRAADALGFARRLLRGFRRAGNAGRFQVCPSALRQPVQGPGADAVTDQAQSGMPNRSCHPAHLPVAALADGESSIQQSGTVLRIPDRPACAPTGPAVPGISRALAGLVFPSFQFDTFRQVL